MKNFIFQLFIPVWTILYILMGYASYGIWFIGGGFCGKAKLPLIAYLIQLTINWLWTPIFFVLHQIGWALVDIIILWLFIVTTSILFYRIDKIASMIFGIPYIAWVSFATALNFSFWLLN